jgi:hypothetical protein
MRNDARAFVRLLGSDGLQDSAADFVSSTDMPASRPKAANEGGKPSTVLPYSIRSTIVLTTSACHISLLGVCQIDSLPSSLLSPEFTNDTDRKLMGHFSIRVFGCSSGLFRGKERLLFGCNCVVSVTEQHDNLE